MSDSSSPLSGDYPELYLEGIRLFNERDYYEAHEVWEEIWQNIGDSSANFYKALIQMAVATLHWERGNIVGARKLYGYARDYMRAYVPDFMGLDVIGFLRMMEEYFDPLLQAIRKKESAPEPNIAQPPQIVLEQPIEY